MYSGLGLAYLGLASDHGLVLDLTLSGLGFINYRGRMHDAVVS